MQNKKQRNIIIAIATVLALALIVFVALYVSGAWFVSQRKAEGTLEFVNGLKIDYSGIYEENSTSSNKNLKFAYLEEKASGETVMHPLELNNVTSSAKYILANPSLKAAEGTATYYLRVKFNINLYYKNAAGEEILINDDTRADFLEIAADYQKNGGNLEISNELELFKSLPSVDASKFVAYNGWFYLGTTSGSVASLADINLTKNFYNDNETPTISIFALNGDSQVVLEMDDEIDFGENMPFSKMELSLDIQAIEESAVSAWN